MGLLDGLLVLGILGSLGFVIYSKLARKNPKIKEVVEGISFNLVEKVPFVPGQEDKIKQVYNEKRTMM